jgi:hypothetical protein
MATVALGIADRTTGQSEMTSRININQHSSIGTLWFVGWLFTVGYLKLGFWWGVLALIVWPYFLGGHFAP